MDVLGKVLDRRKLAGSQTICTVLCFHSPYFIQLFYSNLTHFKTKRFRLLKPNKGEQQKETKVIYDKFTNSPYKDYSFNILNYKFVFSYLRVRRILLIQFNFFTFKE